MSDELDELIDKYKAQFIQSRIDWEIECKYYTSKGWTPPAKPRLNWEKDWDGKLIEKARQLEAAGFEVTRILRKRKFWMKLPKNKTKAEIVAMIEAAIGSDWRGITFKPFTLWWGPNTKRLW